MQKLNGILGKAFACVLAAVAFEGVVNGSEALAGEGTGLYVGLVGGLPFGEENWSNAVTPPTAPGDYSGGMVGLTAGFNHRFDQFLVGIEADYGLASFDAESYTVPGNSCGAAPIVCHTRVNDLGTVRPRLGYEIGNDAVVFATGGIAFGEVEAAAGAFNKRDTLYGWTAGLGAELAVTDSVSAKIEGLYVDLGDLKTGGCATCKTQADFSMVRAGLNYHF